MRSGTLYLIIMANTSVSSKDKYDQSQDRYGAAAFVAPIVPFVGYLRNGSGQVPYPGASFAGRLQ